MIIQKKRNYPEDMRPPFLKPSVGRPEVKSSKDKKLNVSFQEPVVDQEILVVKPFSAPALSHLSITE